MSDGAGIQFGWEVVASGDDGPGLRSRHCLAYDPGARATVLFGGIVWHEGGALRADTWELRGGEWSRVECREPPPARHRGAMIYDARRGACVLFGGQESLGGLLRDTWTYADRRWQQWRPGWWAARPSARCGHCLAFDEAAGEAVLFGGIGGFDRPLGDTWVFDGDSWREVPGPAPPARRYAALAYDPDLGGCVLHGGAEDDHGRRTFGDAWLFRQGAWAPLGPAFDTDPRDDHGLAYHRSAGRLVMLEGVAGTRGVLVREAGGWRHAETTPLHPRHQCAPLAWDEGLGGLVLHGGEARHGGPQFRATLVLRRATRAPAQQAFWM